MPSPSRNNTDTPLRTGYTTGSCATAAAMTGVRFLLHDEQPCEISIPLPSLLPKADRLTIPIERIERENDAVRVTVIKDGGDDPDATHGHEIQTLLSTTATAEQLHIDLHGGKGIGIATLPGLPVPVGEAAINPAPREQILSGIREAAGDFTGTISVLIEVPQGEAIAEKTMNPRLGILGGISILGTQGIVKPYSHDSYKASIAEALDVAAAAGLTTAIFTTGRRTERLYQEAHPETNPLAIIQAADFFAFSCNAAAKRGFTQVTWSLYFGKLVKQAQGLEYTHAKTHPVDFDLLTEHCREAGVSPEILPAIKGANTARQVLMMIKDAQTRSRLLASLTSLACQHGASFAEKEIKTSCVVFDFDDKKLK